MSISFGSTKSFHVIPSPCQCWPSLSCPGAVGVEGRQGASRLPQVGHVGSGWVRLGQVGVHWWIEWAPAWGYITATGLEEEDIQQ